MNPSFPTLPLLGIDVSKLTFDACLLTPIDSKLTATFDNNSEGFSKLDAWLKKHQSPTTLAGIEATGHYGVELLWHLHQQGHRVAQLNPRRIKDYARSQGRKVKTDRTDAIVIASFLRHSQALPLWQPPTGALLELQALVRRREDLLTTLQAERNRLEAAPTAAVRASLERQIQHLKDELTLVDDSLENQVLSHTCLQHSMNLLKSIPGIGRTVALSLLAEIPHISAFARARDLAAFAGLTPSLAQSGTSVRRRGRMTKEGSTLLRKMLYMAALQAVKRPSNPFHCTYKSMLDRGKAKMCVIGALMHKILRVAFGVLKHQTPFVVNFAKI